MKFVFFCAQAFFVVTLFSYCYCREINDVIKRSKSFMAFPRVGRADYSRTSDNENQDYTQKRTGSKNLNTGLWFGPRLGRLQKRDSVFREGPWAYIVFGETPFSRDVKYTPRLGRESEELYEDMELPASLLNEQTA